MSCRIAIAGGGPSGLMMARLLSADGHHVDVFEAEDEIGGLCRSRDVDGYTFDLAGGHILFTRDERVRRFWDELFEGGAAVEHRRETRILHDRDHWVSYPFENALGELPTEHNLRCTEGYLKALLARDGATPPADFASWIRWKMGDGIAELFMEPYNRKVWKADLASMSTSWIEGRVPDAPIEDVLRASLGSTTEGYTHQARFRYPLRGGFADMHERIARPVRDRIQVGHRIERIERGADGGWAVDGEPYERVISTIPLHVLPKVMPWMDRDAAGAASALRYRGVACYLLGVETEWVRPFSWVYLPHAWQGPANRITYLSNYSPGNAPQGKGSILAEVTYDGQAPDVTPAGQRNLGQALGAAGLLDANRLTVSDGYVNPCAYILYDLDFEAKRSALLAYLDGLEGFSALGRFGRYEYHNSDQCLGRALDLHQRLRGTLQRGGGPALD